jgi:hypothetical protein
VEEGSCSTRARRGVRDRPPSRGRTSIDEAHRSGVRTATVTPISMAPVALRWRGWTRGKGGNGGGSHAVQSREEKGMGSATEVTPFKLCDGTVWRGVGGGSNPGDKGAAPDRQRPGHGGRGQAAWQRHMAGAK